MMTTAQEKWVAQVRGVISSRIEDSQLVVADIASALYISERQFYRKLKKLTGRTPNQYIQQMRMERARELLERGFSKELGQLAKSVGYSRPDYFSDLYEGYFGVRPFTHIQANKGNMAGK